MKNRIFIIALIFIQSTFAIAPPTGSANQYFCNSNSWNLADLIVNSSTGQIFWYDENDNSGVQLPTSTTLTNGTTYFAFESTDISDTSLAITVHISSVIPSPIIDDLEPTPCFSNYTLADIPVYNTEGFLSILWFDGPDQATGSNLDQSTPLSDGTTYYAFQGFGDCATSLIVQINFEEVVPAPEGESTQHFCENENATLADLAVFNTTGFANIFWFSDENQSVALALSTFLENETTYYAFQGIGGECVLSLDVTTFIQDIIPAPLGDTIYCIEDNNSTLGDLAISNTEGFTSILFFADINQTQPLSYSTILLSGTTYYATQAIGCDCGCIDILTFTVYFIDDCPNVSINNNELDGFLVYPNPVKDILTINVSNLTLDFKIVIHDIRGRKVYENDFLLKEDSVTIPVSNLEAKVYFVSLISGNQLKTIKFIKQH